MMRWIAATSAAMFLAACAGDGSKEPARTASAPASEGAAPGMLPESNIPRGECGMVLWTLDQDHPAPIFRYLSGKTGEMVIGGTLVTLARTDQSGVESFGVFEHQKFVAATGMTVVVDVRFAMGFDGGVYLERGVVAVETKDGWRTVAPSAGLAGCRVK